MNTENKNIELTNEQILSEVSLIESHLRLESMTFYESQLPLLDIINIQKEARAMLDFVGLNNYTPLITFVDTKSEAGNIELDNSPNVFIEIDNKYRVNSSQILAIMAHEICHKVLFLKGLYYPYITLKNEVLTDLATLYVGFGKLTMNGCHQSYTTTRDDWQNGQKVKITTTYTETIGYLTTDTFTRAYDIVCSCFNIPLDLKIAGLNESATKRIESISKFSPLKASASHLKELLKKIQNSQSSTFRAIVILECILAQIRSIISEKQTPIYNELIAPFDFSDEELKGRLFQAQSVLPKYENSKDEFKDISSSLEKALNIILKSIGPNLDYKGIALKLKAIECPKCGYINHTFLKENRSVFVRCPKCSHIFLWEGSLPISLKTDNRNWVSKLFNLKKK